MKTLHRLAAAVLALATLTPALVQAQTPADAWPSKPLRIIVPTPPGGPYDRTIRPIAVEMSKLLKQPIVIDNRPGAGNIIGTQAGAKADPDGYTVTMTGMVNTIAQSLYPNLSFDIATDFAHVGAIGQGAQWLVVRADSPITSFQDLIDRARREPGKVDYASSGAGSAGHLLLELLQRDTGITLTHVPYKGGAPALQDVLGGVVPLVAIPLNAALPHVRSGMLRVLAISSGQRHPDIPDVPTFRELGHPTLEVSAWVGLSLPKGTPDGVVARLSSTLNTAMQDPALSEILNAEGLSPLRTTPAEYTELVRSDTARWGELVRSLGLKAN